MADMQSAVQPTKHVHATIVDGEAVILDAKREEFLGLNQVATQMWQLLSEGKTISEAAILLREEYQIDDNQIRIDLVDFVESMMERELLEYR
jgi:hypothetical protein